MSWYEAAAYARFAGKSLPTIYHWNSRRVDERRRAASSQGATTAAGAVRPAARFGSMSAYGTFDMAGNVREWTWNATGDKRFILGGGWVDASYAFSDAYAQSPLDRSPINGIRLVRAATTAGLGPEQTRAPVVRVHRDYAVERARAGCGVPRLHRASTTTIARR